MGQKVLFATGLHGDYRLFRELLVAIESEAPAVTILGGDVFPKVERSLTAAIKAQEEFLEETFIPFFEDTLGRSKCLLLFHPGNNDLKNPTLKRLRTWSRGRKGRVVIVDDGLFNNLLELPLLSYPYIPPTPSAVKDWEKWDDEDSKAIPSNFFKGFMSNKDSTMDMAPVILSPDDDFNTIQGDLEVRAHGVKDIDFVFLSQGPPADTPLDMIDSESHIGSRALREFIIKTQPKVSLHGHAHRSPSLSGGFFAMLGKTYAINPGQAVPDSEDPLHYVTFELDCILPTLTHSVYGKAV